MNTPKEVLIAPKVGIMYDIETLGLGVRSVIWEHAMISFSLDDPTNYVRLYQQFLPQQPQLDLLIDSRKVEIKNIGYLVRGSEASRNRYISALDGDGSGDYDDLRAFLNAFVREFEQMTVGLQPSEYIFICKGLNFDVPMIQDLLTSFGIKCPWHYQSVHCLRTTMRDAGLDQHSIPVADGLLLHSALDDCKHQINLWVAAQKLLATGRV